VVDSLGHRGRGGARGDERFDAPRRGGPPGAHGLSAGLCLQADRSPGGGERRGAGAGVARRRRRHQRVRSRRGADRGGRRRSDRRRPLPAFGRAPSTSGLPGLGQLGPPSSRTAGSVRLRPAQYRPAREFMAMREPDRQRV